MLYPKNKTNGFKTRNVFFGGNFKVKSPDKVRMGKRSRAQGKLFEKKVEQDLEKKGWIVIKFSKQVNLELNKLENCKPRFNPFTRSVQMMSGGFPDFICIGGGLNLTLEGRKVYPNKELWDVQLVESKMTGKLDKIEKEKCEWIIQNLKIPIFIAKKIKDGRRIKVEYEEYVTK